MKSPTEVAIELAQELGWRVFPANPNNKRPLISGWPDRASNNPDEIRELFARWQNAMGSQESASGIVELIQRSD